MEDYQNTWQRILADLQLNLPAGVYKTWFARAVFISGSKDEFLIGCPNKMVIDQLNEKYRTKLEQSAHQIIGHAIDFRFIIQKSEPQEIASPLFDVLPETDHTIPETSTSNSIASSSTSSAIPSLLNPQNTFDQFVVGNSNRVAHAAALAITDRPGQSYNPLFLYGGTGVGKTHLVQAIGNALLTHKPAPKVLYFSIERFMNEFIDSLRYKNTNEFKKKYRTADVLIVDDIQFISGKESTQEEFFHTFNELHASGRQIILCSDRPPREIASLTDRLTSRFEGGLTVDISPPDFETRSAIIRAKAQHLGLLISGDIADYLASLAAENIRAIEGMMLKLQSLSLSTNQPTTLEAVKQLFAAQQPATPTKRQPNPNEILKIICETYGVTLKEITGKKRTKNLVDPRQIAMYLLRQDIGLNLQSIGQLLGGRDHTTVMHGIEKVSKLAQTDENTRAAITSLRQSFLR